MATEMKADLPDPFSLMSKVSKPNPPGRNPTQGLLQVRQAGDELKLLSCFGLSKETVLWQKKDENAHNMQP